MDMEMQNPLPLWNDVNNRLHQLQWEHIHLCIDMVDTAEAVTTGKAKPVAETAHLMLDPALHSCQFWWASHRPMWDANMVHRGLLEQQEALLNAYRAIAASECDDQIKRESHIKFIAAQAIQAKILERLVWENL